MIGKVICLGVGALGALAVNLAWSYGRRCFGLEDQIVQVGIVQDGEEQEKDRQEDSVQDEKLEQLQEDKQQDIKLQQQDIAKEEKQLQEDAQQGQLAKKTASDGGCSSEREKELKEEIKCLQETLDDAALELQEKDDRIQERDDLIEQLGVMVSFQAPPPQPAGFHLARTAPSPFPKGAGREVVIINNTLIELGSVVGRGHFGEVRKARLPGTKKFDRVLKVCPIEAPSDVASMQQEYDILKYLHSQQYPYSPKVPQPEAFEVVIGTQQGVFLMGLVMGKTLTENILAHGQPFGLVTVQRIAFDMLTVVAALHALGVCHGDIKPGNLMLSELFDGIKLVDFGRARQVTGLEPVQQLGDRNYAPPEVYLEYEDEMQDPREQDIWGVMYACICMVMGSLHPFAQFCGDVELAHRDWLRACDIDGSICLDAQNPQQQPQNLLMVALGVLDPSGAAKEFFKRGLSDSPRPSAQELLEMPFFDGMEYYDGLNIFDGLA